MKPLSDTSSIKLQKPSKAKEESVFSDAKLKYREEAKENPDAVENFMTWLSKKLFRGNGADAIRKTRQLIIWLVVIVSVIIVVRVLLRSELLRLTRPAPKATNFNFSDITEDLSAVNFDNKIKEALGVNDHRLATRWLYLKVLYVMDRKGLISFAPHKTNIDYRYELKNKELEMGFISLSRIYEYVWYGQFAVAGSRYARHEEEFRQFENKLNVRG